MSEYNERRVECEEAVRLRSQATPGVRALRDVALDSLQANRARLSETVYKRCRHVITENRRVQEAASAIETGQVELLGDLMAKSHRSLRDDYEVSCRELDLMVELAIQQPGVFGARMTGGGFGGCTINLVNAAELGGFRRSVAEQYEAATGLRPGIYVCEPSAGRTVNGPRNR